jgi:hypothetical protein
MAGMIDYRQFGRYNQPASRLLGIYELTLLVGAPAFGGGAAATRAGGRGGATAGSAGGSSRSAALETIREILSSILREAR